MGDKNHQGRGELEPAKDLRLLGELQQLGNGFVHGFQLAQFKQLGDLHLAEHISSFGWCGLADCPTVGCQN